MNLILTDCQPPLLEVSKLKGKASQVYSVLWQSARMDVSYDKRKDRPWNDRRDCGGTTHWTVKGIADHIGLQRKTVSKALCLLLDCGFITVSSYTNNGSGSDHTIWRVTHPNQLENVRHTISIIGSPSERWKKRLTSKKDTHYKGEIYDITEQEPFDHWKDDVSYGFTSSYEDYLENLIDYAVSD